VRSKNSSQTSQKGTLSRKEDNRGGCGSGKRRVAVYQRESKGEGDEKHEEWEMRLLTWRRGLRGAVGVGQKTEKLKYTGALELRQKVGVKVSDYSYRRSS